MKEYSQRECFRLLYPRSHRPSLMINIDSYEVEDVSEHGVKFRIDDDPAFMVDDNVTAIIAFPDGKEFDLSGQVVRIDNEFAGLELDTPFPLSVIKEQTLYIMNNYQS